MRLFLKIRDKGATIIVASHDVELISRYGSRIVSLRRGHLTDDLRRVTEGCSR
jgi:ABC-type ATPase involved in cell division